MPIRLTFGIELDGKLQLVSRDSEVEWIESLDLDDLLQLVIRPLVVEALAKSEIEVSP